MNIPDRLARTAFALSCLLVALAGHGATTDIESHERLRRTAEAHAGTVARGLAPSGATVKVTAGRLDTRLRLPACPVEPESFTNAGQTGMPSSVGVRCPEGAAWSLYVPVRVEVIADVVVLAVPGIRGERITADKVSLEPRDVARITGGYLTALAAIDGTVLRHQARLGTVLNPSLVEPERIVRRGERVRLSAGQGLLAVTVEGEALADAARGERVKVRNVASGIVVEGTVEQAGLVSMSR
jgi:flagella basal body P-ring formation protein FlgA